MRLRRAHPLLAGLIVVVSLAAAPAKAQAPAGCETTHLAVVVNLDNEKHAATIAHARSAVAAGQPRYLHIARGAAEDHRRASLRGIPKVPGKDLDEYPPAASAEGGRGADVMAISRSDNRSAGSKMGRDLTGYCDGQAFILEP